MIKSGYLLFIIVMGDTNVPKFSNFIKVIPKNEINAPESLMKKRSITESHVIDSETKNLEKKFKSSKKDKKHKIKSDKLKQLELDIKFIKSDPRLSASQYDVDFYQKNSTSLNNENENEVYKIRKIGDWNNYVFGVHKFDLPSYQRDFYTVLGAQNNFKFKWSSDQKTFTLKKILFYPLDSENVKNAQSFRYHKNKSKPFLNSWKRKTQNEIDRERIEFGFENIKVSCENDSLQTTISENENLESNLFSKAKKLNEKVEREPSNVNNWLELIEFQDEYVKLITKSSNSIGFVLEKKVEIVRKALLKNPGNEQLMIIHMHLAEELEDSKSIQELWETTISSHSSSTNLWMAYISFVQSHFDNFSISNFRNVYMSAIRYLNRNKTIYNVDSEKHLQFEQSIAEIIIRACNVEIKSGYPERSIAILQSLIEINFNCPQVVKTFYEKAKSKIADWSSARQILLVNYQKFWDSELPRFGEIGSIGWAKFCDQNIELRTDSKLYNPIESHTNIQNESNDESQIFEKSLQSNNAIESANLRSVDVEIIPEDDLKTQDTNFTDWILKEQIEDSKDWMPRKVLEIKTKENNKETEREIQIDDPLDDTENFILFEDIKDVLVYFSYPEIPIQILISFFHILGLNITSQNTTNSILNQSESFEQSEFFFEFIPDFPKMASIDVNQSISNTKINLNSFYDLFEAHIKPDLQKLELDSKRKEFALNCLRQAVLMPSILKDNFLCQNFNTCRILLAGKEEAKNLLQNQATNLSLWNAYARSEILKQRPKEAKKVFSNAIKGFITNPEITEIVRNFAEFELFQNNYSQALYILISIPENQYNSEMEHTVNATRIIKDRKIYEMKFGLFIASIESTLKNKPKSEFNDLLQIFFNLSICCILFEDVTFNIQKAIEIFNVVIRKFKEWSLSPYITKKLKSIILSYQERFYIHFITLIFHEYQRLNLEVPSKFVHFYLNEALANYPTNPLFLSTMLLMRKSSQLTAQLRRYFDTTLLNLSRSKILPLTTYLFALRSEIRQGSGSRIRNLFEKVIQSQYHLMGTRMNQSILIWKMYLEFEISQKKIKFAKGILFRAIRACPWAKELWLFALKQLEAYLKNEEKADLINLMSIKEIRFRSTPPL